MKNFFLLLLTIGMMAVTAQAQEVLDFKSKTEKHVVYYIPTDDLVQIIHTSKTIEDELADQMIEDYAKVFHSSGPNEPAVQILKSDISDIVLFIQYKDDYIYSFRMLAPKEGWLQATSKSRRKLEELLCDSETTKQWTIKLLDEIRTKEFF